MHCVFTTHCVCFFGMLSNKPQGSKCLWKCWGWTSWRKTYWHLIVRQAVGLIALSSCIDQTALPPDIKAINYVLSAHISLICKAVLISCSGLASLLFRRHVWVNATFITTDPKMLLFLPIWVIPFGTLLVLPEHVTALSGMRFNKCKSYILHLSLVSKRSSLGSIKQIKICWIFLGIKFIHSRSRQPRGLRRRSEAARLLRLWVRIPAGAWKSVC